MAEESVMPEPRDQLPAALGRGHLRACHADREQVIGVLKAAFVQGRLGRDEFDLRVGQALAARTYADLATLTADLLATLALWLVGLVAVVLISARRPARITSAGQQRSVLDRRICSTALRADLRFRRSALRSGRPYHESAALTRSSPQTDGPTCLRSW
jgi:hypothetical protein